MKKAFLIALIPIALTGAAFSLYGLEVTATIARDGDENKCPLSSPVFVKVQNNTFSTIRNVTFDLELFRDSRSINVLNGTTNRVFDTVIPPLSYSSGCLSDSYIKSFIDPNEVDINTATRKQVALSSLQSVKNFREFEPRHTVYISNVQATYLK